LGGEVYKIVPKKDITKDNGVYVNRYKYNYHDSEKAVQTVERYNLDEADEKLGLFKTYEEAKTLGNPSKLMEIEFSKLKDSLKSKDLQLEELRQRIEEKSLLNKDAINDKEHKRREASLEHEQLNDKIRAFHEAQKAENETRKALNEMLKLSLSLAVIIAGGLMAAAKWYKTDS
jgi:hypothetical protein